MVEVNETIKAFEEALLEFVGDNVGKDCACPSCEEPRDGMRQVVQALIETTLNKIVIAAEQDHWCQECGLDTTKSALYEILVEFKMDIPKWLQTRDS
jgi:uncharacterized protein (UPF0212 family)